MCSGYPLQDREARAPSLGEVLETLPTGIRLISYEPKDAPFAVVRVSVVTNAGKFFRSYIRDLAWRMEHPQRHAVAPLPDILDKLAAAGLQFGGGVMTTPNSQGKIHLHVLIPRCLKSRLDVLSFRSVISNSELVTFALERLIAESEADMKALVMRVAERKAERINEAEFWQDGP